MWQWKACEEVLHTTTVRDVSDQFSVGPHMLPSGMCVVGLQLLAVSLQQQEMWDESEWHQRVTLNTNLKNKRGGEKEQRGLGVSLNNSSRALHTFDMCVTLYGRHSSTATAVVKQPDWGGGVRSGGRGRRCIHRSVGKTHDSSEGETKATLNCTTNSHSLSVLFRHFSLLLQPVLNSPQTVPLLLQTVNSPHTVLQLLQSVVK